MVVSYVGWALFAHACYSVWELNQTVALSRHLDLHLVPANIYIELLLGFILVVGGLAKSTKQQLRPVFAADEFAEQNAKGINSFKLLETRPGFQNFASRRQHYMEMMKASS